MVVSRMLYRQALWSLEFGVGVSPIVYFLFGGAEQQQLTSAGGAIYSEMRRGGFRPAVFSY